MLITVLSIVLIIAFIVLALIHFNWALGGEWGLEKALPTKENGQRVLSPGNFGSAVVGFGLMLFGLFYLSRSGCIDFELPKVIVTYAGWMIPAIFILRSIGDFKYAGFFKKVKSTEFGKIDSKLFSPLCLILGVFGIIVQLLS